MSGVNEQPTPEWTAHEVGAGREGDGSREGEIKHQQPSSGPEHSPTHPTVPLPRTADVDELLAESLRAQNEQEFSWKEPDRGPRWYERAEQEAAMSGVAAPYAGVAGPPASAAAMDKGRRTAVDHPYGTSRTPGPRIGGAVFAAVAVALALWVLASVVLGIYIPPLVVALGVCSLAGLALVAAGLRPKPGQRI